MTWVETDRLNVPCPSCCVPQRLVAAYRTDPGNGQSRASVAECTRCWSTRARALNDARAALRSSGELAGGGRLMTWQGELLSLDHEHDGLEGALLSAMLRRDIAPGRRAELLLPVASPVEAGAGASRKG